MFLRVIIVHLFCLFIVYGTVVCISHQIRGCHSCVYLRNLGLIDRPALLEELQLVCVTLTDQKCSFEISE